MSVQKEIFLNESFGDSPNHVIWTFHAWNEILNFARDRETDLAPELQHSRAVSSDATEFSGVDSFEAALTLGNNGWHDHVPAVKELTEKMAADISKLAVKLRDVWTEGDGEMSAERAATGDPESFKYRAEQTEEMKGNKKGSKFVRILLNAVASGSVHPNTYIAKGATVATLVQLLDYLGHRVEVTVNITNATNRGFNFFRHEETPADANKFTAAVVVKQFGQPLDLPQLMFALGHPAFLRRIFFSIAEGLADPFRTALGVPHGGYGRCEDYKKEGTYDVYIGSSTHADNNTWPDPKWASRWVRERLEEQGVKMRSITMNDGGEDLPFENLPAEYSERFKRNRFGVPEYAPEHSGAATATEDEDYDVPAAPKHSDPAPYIPPSDAPASNDDYEEEQRKYREFLKKKGFKLPE